MFNNYSKTILLIFTITLTVTSTSVPSWAVENGVCPIRIAE